MERIESKIDALAKDIGNIKVTMATNTAQLAEHMRRTEVLEKRVDSTWAKMLTVLSITSALVMLAKELFR